MNYLTAIIAVPLFCTLFLFELGLVWKYRASIVQSALRVVYICLLVSFLQMVSCWFWLFGFVFAHIDGVFSEGLDEGESTNCFGLVGAEVILAIFQCIFTLLTFHQWYSMRRIYLGPVLNRVHANAPTPISDIILASIFAAICVIYMVFAWFTGQNRRCPQGNHILAVMQHYPWPIWLGIDVIFSVGTYYYCDKIVQAIDDRKLSAPTPVGAANAKSNTPSSAPEHQVLSGFNSGKTTANQTQLGTTNQTTFQTNATRMDGNNGGASKSTLRRMQDIASFYKKQAIISIIGGAFSVVVFIIQFVGNVSALRVIACIFCAFMYCIYGMRRLPIIVMYTKWDGYEKYLCSVCRGDDGDIESGKKRGGGGGGKHDGVSSNNSGSSTPKQVVEFTRNRVSLQTHGNTTTAHGNTTTQQNTGKQSVNQFNTDENQLDRQPSPTFDQQPEQNQLQQQVPISVNDEELGVASDMTPADVVLSAASGRGTTTSVEVRSTAESQGELVIVMDQIDVHVDATPQQEQQQQQQQEQEQQQQYQEDVMHHHRSKGNGPSSMTLLDVLFYLKHSHSSHIHSHLHHLPL